MGRGSVWRERKFEIWKSGIELGMVMLGCC